jgi:hypothetical protein
LSELGNLTQRIFLSLRRMSTVKIRAGSLFRNTRSRIGAKGAVFERGQAAFPHPSTSGIAPPQVVHRSEAVATCRTKGIGCKVS